MKNKNTNCRLVKHYPEYNFTCGINCPRRVPPSEELRRKGLICAYQKQRLNL